MGRLRQPATQWVGPGPLFLGVGVVGVVLVSSVWALGLPTATSALPPWVTGHGSLGEIVTDPQPICGAVNGVPSGALSIPNSGPAGSFAPGTQLAVTIELREILFPGSVVGGPVELPTTLVVFATNGTASETIVLSPRTLNLSAAGWSDPTLGTANRTFNQATGFPSDSTASLSTELLAVQADAPFGTMLVEARWDWTLTPPGSPGIVGPWSLPATGGGGSSVVFPHPFVRLLSSSPQDAVIGETFTVTLAGAALSQTFLLKLENSTTGATLNLGSVVNPGSVDASFSGSIQILGSTGLLDPGSYLVHVHDQCGGILYSLPVFATYASSVAVRFGIVPAACGPLLFDQHPYSAGSSWTGAPGRGAHSLSVAGCTGHPFREWQTAGGIAALTGPGRAVSVRVCANATEDAVFG